MIFSTLFKAKWQNKKHDIRIEAISELDPSNQADLAILEKLVYDDPHMLVRQSALLKAENADFLLGVFDKADKGMREYAQKRIEAQLLAEHSTLFSTNQKLRFINLCKSKAFLEQWILQESDPQVATELLAIINKPHLLSQVVLNHADLTIKTLAVTAISELSVLEKLQKRSLPEAVATLITDKVNEIKTAIELPIQLKKSVQLILAKLLALKDVKNYQEMADKKQILIDEWQVSSQQFNCLSESEVSEFQEKYELILKQIEKVFVVEYEKYQQERIAAKLDANRLAQEQAFKGQIVQIKSAITDAVFNNVDIDNAKVKLEIESLTLAVDNSIILKQEKDKFHDKLTSLAEQLERLPLVAEAVANATQLIAKLANMPLVKSINDLNEKKNLFDGWKKEWQHNSKNVEDVLPKSLVKAYSELNTAWLEALAPVIQEQKKLFFLTQKKLPILRGLINQGKFFAAFGLHAKLAANYVLLSENQQAKLQRDYDAISTQIAELSDWETYIATPRKQELLAEALLLANTPNSNIAIQADEVKRLRKTWNSLGHAEEELDKSLNAEFDIQIEKAFEPCRIYYTQQDELRKQYVLDRKTIINKVTELVNVYQNEATIDFKQLETDINELTKQWQNCGSVEKQDYIQLVAEFNAVITPLKLKLQTYFKVNETAKQQLITQANEQLTKDDVNNAANQLIELQKLWQGIGFSGPKSERKLWQQFRKINDQVFANREKQREENKKAHDNQLDTFLAQVDVLAKKQCSSKEEHQSALEEIQQLVISSQSLKHNGLSKKLSQLTKAHEVAIDKLQQDEKKTQFDSLLQLYQQLSENVLKVEQLESNEQFQQLSNSWQKGLVNSINQVNNDELRHKITLELEILAGVESPEEFVEMRMTVQVKLLTEKHNLAADITLENKIEQWLACGLMAKVDQTVLSRVKNVLSTIH